MDKIDRKIAACLAEDARLSLADISVRVGLSTSAVNERIQKLRQRGAIRAIRADLDPAAFGRPVLAFLFVALARGVVEEAFRADIAARPEVTACHHVTGGWNYLIQLRLEGLEALEAFLSTLKAAGWIERSETMLALSAVVEPPVILRGL